MDLKLIELKPIQQATYTPKKLPVNKRAGYLWCFFGTIGIVIFVIWFVVEALHQFMGV